METRDYSICLLGKIKQGSSWYYANMILWQLGKSLVNFIRIFLWVVVILVSLSASTVPLRDPVEKIRRYTRLVEFEFVGWTLDALWSKVEQFSVDATSRMTEEQRQALVVGYFERLKDSQQIARQVELIVSDPNHVDKPADLESLQEELVAIQRTLAEQQPYVESILQQQSSFVLGELGFGLGGRIFPPLAFEFTPLPLTLIVSPRDVIQQDANIPLLAAIDLTDRISLEEEVDGALNVSSLVVNIGGIGTYPTMVLESSSLAWVAETVIHEWVHNYLTLRPLGFNYLTSEELRTMNETTAAILGREIAYEMLSLYYPDFVPEPTTPSSTPPSEDPTTFDFRAEMHETRITADQLLAEGKIEEAEEYMEERRQMLWDHGYRIRKLNQAYFAFHGAYADEPDGAAGEDPVGDAVRELWERIASPVEFLRTMSWMNDFGDLEEVLNEDLATP